MKKILSCFLCLVLLLSLAACGGTSGDSTSSSSSQSSSSSSSQSSSDGEAADLPALPDEPVQLLVYFQNWNPSANEEATEESPDVYNVPRLVRDAYVAMHPNAEIEFFSGFMGGSVAEEFSIMLNGGTCPDMLFTNEPAVLASGNFKTLDDHMSAPNTYETGTPIWKDMFFDYMFGSGQMSTDSKDNIIGVPYAVHVPGVVGLFYNKDLFAEYNVTEIPDTWQKLHDLALMFREEGLIGYIPWDGNKKIDVGNWDFWSMLSPALSVGYEVLDLDGSEIVEQSENIKAALEGWYYAQTNECVQNMFRLYKYKYAVVLEQGVENIDYTAPWIEGKVAIKEEGLWHIPRENSNTQRMFDFDLFLHPWVSTDTNITIDGVNVVLDDASKVRVPEKTAGGPEKLDVSGCMFFVKPELQQRSETNFLYAIDYMKFVTNTENMSQLVDGKKGETLGATRTCAIPGILIQWMQQPFNKPMVGGINVSGFPVGDTATVRNALLEQYVKNMITEAEFFLQWDIESFANFMEYVEAEELQDEVAGYDIVVPNGVSA